MSQPTVILAMPFIYGLDACIEKNLRHLGYNVINLCFDDRDSYYPNLGSRLIAQFHKHITHNSDYKKQLKFQRYQAEINQRLATLGGKKAKFALCINARIYPLSVIEQIRQNAQFCVNYQWDGVGKFADILNYLAFFDRVLVFDPKDAENYPQYHFQAASNFYFDYELPKNTFRQPENTNGIYFLGGYEDNRVQAIADFLQYAREHHLPLDFYIYCKDDRARKCFGDDGIQYLDRSTILSFEQNLQKTCECQVVIDFVQYQNYGLSLRIFDALCYDKKLITTNQSIQKYDFYHPDNIFIWNGNPDELAHLESFLAQPYQPINPAIKQYYSFSKWLERAFRAA